MNKREHCKQEARPPTVLEDEHHDIIAATDTFLHDNILDSELIDSKLLAVFRRDRNKHGGGVMLLLKNNIPACYETKPPGDKL